VSPLAAAARLLSLLLISVAAASGLASAQGQPGQRRGEDRDLFRQLVQASLVD
jgi:hypothetical protein